MDKGQMNKRQMNKGNLWWVRHWEQLRSELGIGSPDTTLRTARVKQIEVLPGSIIAIMQERDATTCRIETSVSTLSSTSWQRVSEQLASLAMVNAQILSGAMPPEIEQVFAEAGTHLLPTVNDIRTSCSCCSPAACRHLPQIWTLIAEMLGEDPGLLFILRGRDRGQVLRDARPGMQPPHATHPAPQLASSPPPPHTPDGSQARSGRDQRSATTPSQHADQSPPTSNHTHLLQTGEPGTPADLASQDLASQDLASQDLASQIDQYWGNRSLLKQFHHHVAAPKLELSLLRRLGPLNTTPNSQPQALEEAMALYEQMVAIYRRITDEALSLAYSSDDDTQFSAAGATQFSAAGALQPDTNKNQDDPGKS